VCFHSILDNAAECDANVVPLGQVQVGTPSRFAGVRLPDTFSGHLADDLKHAWSTPRFGWITFDETGSGYGTSCCGETPGPDNPTPGFSPLLAPIFQALGLPIPTAATGGGQVGAVLLDPRYVEPGSVDTTGQYNHYSALRSYEDLLGTTRGATDGLGHLGFAAAPGLQPFGRDVFNRPRLFPPRSY
jgi:hypothetical protein